MTTSNNTQRNSYQPLFLLAILGLLTFMIAFGAVVWRIDKAPDIFTDEILYSRLGFRVLEEGAVVWDHGTMAVIHPPYYYLLDSLFLRVAGAPGADLYAPGNIFEFVYHNRILNALLAGITAIVLFRLGVHLRGLWLGILLALLFIFDPFGVRINRRAMLETLAVLFSLIGFLVFISGNQKRRKLGHAILAGVFLGAGMLTKELAFIVPLAIGIFGVWELLRREMGWSYPLVTAGLSFISYLIFPIWVFYTGNWEKFIGVKALALERLIGLVHTSGWNRPGVSILDFLLNRLLDYGSSYLILFLGGIATMIILFRHLREPMGRLLGTWGILIYPFYGFITFFGSGNDQFFYFLLLPSMIFLGYALVEKDDLGMGKLATRNWNLLRNKPGALFYMRERGSGLLLLFGVILIVIILPFNFISWISNYGVGLDTGYQQLSQYIQANIPPGTPINASGDNLKYIYFLPDHPIAEAASPQEAFNLGVKYFVIVPKDIQAKFGNISEEFAAWVVSNGQLIFSTSGETYGDIFLFYLPQVGDPLSEPLVGTGNPNYHRTFEEATTGFIGSLFVLMGIVYLLCLWLIVSSTRKSLEEERRFEDVSIRNPITVEDKTMDGS